MTTDELIAILIAQESDGDDNAIGDKHLKDMAYGPLQVRMPVCIDVNARYGTSITPEQHRGDRTLSIQTFWRYMSIYATHAALDFEPTPLAMARIWNGGPAGWRKRSTLVYRTEVIARMEARGLDPWKFDAPVDFATLSGATL